MSWNDIDHWQVMMRREQSITDLRRFETIRDFSIWVKEAFTSEEDFGTRVPYMVLTYVPKRRD